MTEPHLEEPPLGWPVADWRGAQAPRLEPLSGAHAMLLPIDAARDGEALYAESHPPHGDAGVWTYLPSGPYRSVEELRVELAKLEEHPDRLCFVIVPRGSDRAAGTASYLRIEPAMGAIEIGHIWFGVSLQRTSAATEAIYLLARHAFDTLGFRRLEWKCNALNAASRAAAERFGFTFEGIFRQHQVVKGRNRDTAWYALLDREWPATQEGFERWLGPENFDSDGRQRRRLRELIDAARRSSTT